MSQVRNVKQDRNGNILIAATWGGVFRYDGKSFTNLTSKVGYHRFWDVLEDRRGNLWFASLDSGVYYYNGKSFQHFTTREGLANNAVMCIYEDKAGIIWFGTEGGGVSSYDARLSRQTSGDSVGQGKFFQNFTKNPNPCKTSYNLALFLCKIFKILQYGLSNFTSSKSNCYQLSLSKVKAISTGRYIRSLG
jgi:hypothetical protein